MREPPPPGECHPAYQDKPWARDWLNGAAFPGQHHLRIPVMTRLSFDLTGGSANEPSVRERVLTKEKAAGLAPYVGNPFMYVWYVATDELGRSVSGDTQIHYYTPPL
jgi:hypothetical protein